MIVLFIGCDECMRSYDVECEQHRLTPVQDKAVLTRAWASLPQILNIFRIEDDNNGNILHSQLQSSLTFNLLIMIVKPLPRPDAE